MSFGTLLRRLEGDIGDLLQKHERGRDLEEFARYASDPVGFIRDVLGGRSLERRWRSQRRCGTVPWW